MKLTMTMVDLGNDDVASVVASDVPFGDSGMPAYHSVRIGTENRLASLIISGDRDTEPETFERIAAAFLEAARLCRECRERERAAKLEEVA